MQKRIIAGIIALLPLFSPIITGCLALPAAENDLKQTKHVLLLNSYHQRMTWVKDLVRGVEETLKPEKNNILLHVENLDSKKFHSPDYFAIFYDYLKIKYKNTKLSLILSSDNHAYDFLRNHRDSLFPGVPVSFSGVNNFQEDQIAGLEGFTGVAEIFSALETARLALRLHPDTRELFVINDYLKTGRLREIKCK